MTGANLIGFLQPDVSMQLDMATATAKKEGNGDNTTMFASFMRQTNVARESAKPSDGGVTPNQSYDKYKYKDKSIEASNSNPIKDKLDNSKDSIDKLERDVISAVSTELDVDEETVENAMAALGLNVLDLLQPSNLAELSIQLTGVDDTVELLMSDSFQSLLGEVTELGSEFIKELELVNEQFDELIALMAGDEQGITDSEISDFVEELLQPEVMASENNTVTDEAVLVGEAIEQSDVKAGSLIADEGEESEAIPDKEFDSDSDSDNLVVVSKEVADDNKESAADLKQSQDSDDDGYENKDNGVKKNETVRTDNMAHSSVVDSSNANTTELHETTAPSSSYVSVDTVEMIQQIVEKVKVTVASDFNNVEMQLNPENLGKIYINISSKEGNVSAHLVATNDVVREALEGQMAELRENLSQAGIKVDALEVTVASHGFERNLEQDQSRQEQEGAYQEKASRNRRRNLDISSLDEISGLMTEEERLVAQMMIDNGNSVDLTA